MVVVNYYVCLLNVRGICRPQTRSGFLEFLSKTTPRLIDKVGNLIIMSNLGKTSELPKFILFIFLSLGSFWFKPAMKDSNLIKAFHNSEEHLAHSEMSVKYYISFGHSKL